MLCFSPEATEVNSTIDPPIRIYGYTPGKKNSLGPPWLVAMTWNGFQVAIALPLRRGFPGPQRLLRRRWKQRRSRGGGQRPQRGARVEGAVVATGFLWPLPLWGPLKGQEKHAMAYGVSGRIKSLGFLVDVNFVVLHIYLMPPSSILCQASVRG